MFVTGFLGLLALGVWIYCVIDALTTPADQVRNLPKIAWLFVVVLLFEIGALAWLIAGRPWNAKATTPRGESGGGFAGLGTSAVRQRTRERTRPMSPDDDDEFLASLSKRNEEQRRRDTGEDEGPAAV